MDNRISYYSVEPNLAARDIMFRVFDDIKEDVPKEHQELVFRLNLTLMVLRKVFREDQKTKFEDYFNQLVELSRLGLGTYGYAHITMVNRGLDQLKQEVIAYEMPRIKSEYVKGLLKWSCFFGLPTLIIGLFLNLLFCDGMNSDCIDWSIVSNCLVLWSGAMFGVVISFITTRRILNFDELMLIDPDGLKNSYRLLFTGVLALAFGFLFHLQFLKLEVGDFATSKALSEPIHSFIIGLVLGVNEKIIGGSFVKKTDKILI